MLRGGWQMSAGGRGSSVTTPKGIIKALELRDQGTQGECDENMFCTTRVFTFRVLPSSPTSSS